MDQQQIAVRAAVAQDIPRMADAMARAFHDDPVATWLIPDDDARTHVQRDMFTVSFTNLLTHGHGELHTAQDGAASAVWVRPGKRKPPKAAMKKMMRTMLRHRRHVRIVRSVLGMRTIRKLHPKQPHWYLQGIGTDPDFQRRGLASALLTRVLERCDAERMPAYLETQKARNVRIYERFGFRVNGEIDLPLGGPHVWLMWRDPA